MPVRVAPRLAWAPRVWGALLLVALVAFTAMTAEAAKTRRKTRTGTTTSARVHRSGTARTAALRRRASAGTAVSLRKARRTRGAVASARHRRRGRRERMLAAPPGGGVWARNAVVIDPATDQVLYEKHSDQTVPIASLTKLMSALVFLDQKPDLRRVVEVTPEEIHGGGHTQLWKGEQVALYDLLHMSLMNSDNVATRVLARESGLSREDFIAHMNQRARTMGMANSQFADPTGLDSRNVATALDVARLLRAAANHYLIREVTTTPTYVFVTEYPGRRRTVARTHQIVNTNRLLRSNRYEFACSKTGFISQSGYCLATWVKDRGRDLIAVVLGAPTNATRFADCVRLVQRTQTLTLEQP